MVQKVGLIALKSMNHPKENLLVHENQFAVEYFFMHTFSASKLVSLIREFRVIMNVKNFLISSKTDHIFHNTKLMMFSGFKDQN